MRTLQFDGIVFDATVGDSDDDWRLGTHNSIPMLRLATAAMRRGRMLSEGATLIANHLAMTLHAPKEETERLFSALGITVALYLACSLIDLPRHYLFASLRLKKRLCDLEDKLMTKIK
jgi:hypothetical protein